MKDISKRIHEDRSALFAQFGPLTDGLDGTFAILAANSATTARALLLSSDYFRVTFNLRDWLK